MSNDTVSAVEDGFRRVPDEMAEKLHRLFPGEFEGFYKHAGRIFGLAKSTAEQPR